MKKTIKMDLTKSTKGTHVYANNETGSPVSSTTKQALQYPQFTLKGVNCQLMHLALLR